MVAVDVILRRNNDIGQRTSMEKSGLAFAQTDNISYLYNDRQELTSATAQNETAYNYTYSFDSIGNRATASERGTGSTYTANTLNQYTLINALSPSYDNDGNMLGDGASWTYVWDAENRLKSATNGTKTLEFAYDYMSRRVERKVYVGESLTEHKKYLYDNYKHIETLDAANSNSLLQKYLWGGDRLLAVYDVSNGESYSYFIDANKNIGQLVDASGNIVAKYEYGPFGQITKSEGSYADSNPYRFSSEQWDNDLGLVYYNYRYYSPSLGRWLSRDPIGEEGGWNLYGMLSNDCENNIDNLGMKTCCDGQGNKVDEVADDAGRKCCPDEIGIVELRAQSPNESVKKQALSQFLSGTFNFNSINTGHAFISSPSKKGKGTTTVGFYPSPKDTKYDGTTKGVVKDDSSHQYTHYIEYRACPETIKNIDFIKQDYYKLLDNKNGDNYSQCTTWACDRLRGAGFKNVPNALEPHDISQNPNAKKKE